MPIYEYSCENCLQPHEALQKMSDDPLIDCPSCGAAALKKKVSASGFRLGGSGWYETDFKTGKKKNISEKPSASAPSTGHSCGTGSCSKCA